MLEERHYFDVTDSIGRIVVTTVAVPPNRHAQINRLQASAIAITIVCFVCPLRRPNSSFCEPHPLLGLFLRPADANPSPVVNVVRWREAQVVQVRGLSSVGRSSTRTSARNR